MSKYELPTVWHDYDGAPAGYNEYLADTFRGRVEFLGGDAWALDDAEILELVAGQDGIVYDAAELFVG